MPMSVRPSFFLILLTGALLTGCGYRAPLHKSYIPEVKDTRLLGGSLG